MALTTPCAGLSPRMRGNLLSDPANKHHFGSIPAHAGKPLFLFCNAGKFRVYPRACGETHVRGHEVSNSVGLSPRMRGNRPWAQVSVTRFGSIPAHAGKPEIQCLCFCLPEVYPRACGETYRPAPKQKRAQGLSPRMRGNHACTCDLSDRYGSIPAHAGKPSQLNYSISTPRVYPRACGETSNARRTASGAEGLSPRMRGNHGWAQVSGRAIGSIPAHAGKPRGLWRRLGCLRVYPRACGETRSSKTGSRCILGLSPRMRGNRGRRK